MLSVKHPKICKLGAIEEVLKYARGGHVIISKVGDKITTSGQSGCGLCLFAKIYSPCEALFILHTHLTVTRDKTEGASLNLYDFVVL